MSSTTLDSLCTSNEVGFHIAGFDNRDGITMSDEDDRSYSLSISSSFVSLRQSEETIYTPSVTTRRSSQATEDFELISHETLEQPGDSVSSCSTSLSHSVFDYEYAYGRRYHGYKSGQYPFPNDVLEQQREETEHALVLELTVCL